jgi:murein DD-endopeptidase MepM/ murein hydrolase activator NlpD
LFVIRDYKFRSTRRPRRLGSRRILAASVLLVGALGTVKFLDLNADPATEAPAAKTETGLVATVLPLPGRSQATPAPSVDPAAGSAMPPTVLPVLVPPPAPATLRDSEGGAAMPIQDPASEKTSGEAAPRLLAYASPVEAPRHPVAAPTSSEHANTVANDEAPDTSTPALDEPRWVEHEVRSGESLARIFADRDLSPALLHRIVTSSDTAATLAELRPGQTLRFRFDGLGELTELEHHRSAVEHVDVRIADDGIETAVVSRDVEVRTNTAAGIIASSLFIDGQKAGLSDAKIMELAEIFGWDIDFALEIRAGDQFRLLFEEHYLDGEKLRDGPILAAEFTNRGTVYRAVRYERSDGEIGYYDDTGHSKRRAFIRTPIKFARISSRFNPKRWHPVLQRWRSHKGVDYAAPTGTPIKASGDGKVVFRGTKGGYGRTVILQHAGKYTTLYAHMSKYSKRARVGSRVKQGQVIGYVGQSGLATGPHLHYEFRVNGVHKDPLRVKLPKALSLPDKEIAAFKKATAPLLAELDAVATDTMVASLGEETTR